MTIEALTNTAALDPEAFIRAHTRLGRAALVPELNLYLATEITPIWQATEAWLAEHNVEPPFWAFAWPGGQALARYILDQPEAVAGLGVVDFATGGRRLQRPIWSYSGSAFCFAHLRCQRRHFIGSVWNHCSVPTGGQRGRVSSLAAEYL